MKTWMTALAMALGLALAAPHTADAQIFKKNSKAAKVAGTAAGILGALTGTKSGSDATATPSADGKYVSTMSNGVTIEAPASAKAQFAFEGAYGDTATGYVKVIIKVTTQADQQQANFGSSLVAYDADGNMYKDNGSHPGKTFVAGLPTKYTFGNNIMNVPLTLTSFAVVQGGWYLNAGEHSGKEQTVLRLRNVPITWGAATE